MGAPSPASGGRDFLCGMRNWAAAKRDSPECLQRCDFFPLCAQGGDGFFVAGELGAGLFDQGGGGAGGEANVCELSAEAGDVLFAFRDFFVEAGEFGGFVDKPRQRDHVFRAANHEGGGFGLGFAIREDADAI